MASVNVRPSSGRGSAPLPPWLLAIAAMASVQLSAALSVDLIEALGSAGTAWLRLSFGALVFVTIARPPLRSISRQDVPAVLGLGLATAVMTMSLLSAIEHISLGMAVAIQFLGPLTVAALRSHSIRALAWPVLALVGVVLVTRPWHGDPDVVGIAFALLAAAGWGAYVLLTQQVGDRFSGLRGLSLSIPIAAILTAFVGVPQALPHLGAGDLLAGLLLALLMPVLPFALEMAALRRMTHAAFGTLMSLEPAIGVVLGFLVLGQDMAVVQLVGVGLVVLAGAAAQGGAARPAAPRYEPSGLA